MLEHESANVTEVSCTTTTLVKFHSGLNQRSNKFMKKSKGFLVTGAVSPSSSQCAITSNNSTVTSRTSGGDGRPPFITTVCRGKFLPSKFDLMVERSLFTFSSRPRPVGLVTRHQCSLSGGPLKEHNSLHSPPRGAHDYYNMMWDPHVYRGKTSTTTATPSRNKMGENENENKVAEGNPVASEGKYRKKRATYYTSSSNNGMNRSRYKITTRVTTKTKGLTKLIPDEERHHTHVQTEQFLEDLSGDGEVDEHDAVVQTDPIHDLPIKKKSDKDQFLTTKSGVDVCTQVLPGELYSFDEEVQPIVEALVGKVLQQSLMETMEEEELLALREQQNRFHEKRERERKLLKELQEEQERITQEKERLKQELLKEENSGNPFVQENVILDQVLRSASMNQPNIPTSYLIELLPSVLNSLRQEGFLSDNVGDDIFSTFVPMWRSSSKAESEVGEPLTMESSGSISVDPEEASKLNVTSERPEEEDEEEEESMEHESNNNIDTEITGDEDRETTATTVDCTEEEINSPTIIMNTESDKLPIPNGRIPSFERVEGSAIEGEVK